MCIRSAVYLYKKTFKNGQPFFFEWKEISFDALPEEPFIAMTLVAFILYKLCNVELKQSFFFNIMNPGDKMIKQISFEMTKSLVAIVIVLSALSFESVVGSRLYVILLILLGFVFVNHMKKKREKWIIFGLLLEIALIFILESQSRFLINYFLHTLYILVLADAALSLNLKRALIIQGITLIVANYKYSVLIGFEPTFINITEFGFFLLINGVIAISLDFMMTMRKQKMETDKLYDELLKSQDQLESMATLEERSRIAREIHDSLGHDMTGLIMQMEMANHMLEQNPQDAKVMLGNAIISARSSMNAVRRVVETLKNETYNLEEMIDQFAEKTGISVICNSCKITHLGETISKALYRVVQEALTNALKHGKATEVMINIKVTDDMVIFNIKDNGMGNPIFTKGFGLKSMTKRIEGVGGKIHFSSTEGFEINGHMVRSYD